MVVTEHSAGSAVDTRHYKKIDPPELVTDHPTLSYWGCNWLTIQFRHRHFEGCLTHSPFYSRRISGIGRQ
jgi:hypothetical protein